MVEVLDRLEELAKERADSLERTSKALGGESEGLLFIAHDSCHFVRFLSVIWALMQIRFREGGVPTRRLLNECNLLLTLGAGVRKQLVLLSKVWQERRLPTDVAQPIFKDVQEATGRLDKFLETIRDTRERASSSCEVSADPREIKKRIKQADEQGEWIRLADAVSRMRQPGS